MRSEDYTNQKLTFARLDPVQMERTGLLEGLRPKNPSLEDYVKVIKGHVPSGAWRYVDIVVELRTKQQNENLTPLQKFYLKNALEVLRPRPLQEEGKRDFTFWGGISNRTLENIGLLVEAPQTLEDIATQGVLLEPWHVMTLEKPLSKPITEYRNNIKPQHKIRLDGRETVKKFAEEKKFWLPESYLEDGRMSAGMIDILRQNNYTLLDAMVAGAKAAAETRPNDKIVVFTFNNYSTGDESRLFPLNINEAFEHFNFFGVEKTTSVLGDESGKYADHQVLSVPKRTPVNGREFDPVVLSYLEQFYENPPQDPMWWINARIDCLCEYSLINSFFKKVKGKKKRMGHVFIDAHSGNAILTNLEKRKRDGRPVSVWSYIPVPSATQFSLADNAKYNMYIKDGKKPLREEDINIILIANMMSNPGSSLLRLTYATSLNYVKNPLNKI